MAFINKYNSILLSVIGTLGVIALLMILFMLSRELDTNYKYDTSDKSQYLKSEETAKELLQLGKHQQYLSFDEPPICIDSLHEIYLYAVNQKTLKRAESKEKSMVSDYVAGMSKENRRFKEIERKSGNFNNLIIYNALTNERELIFKKRLHISTFTVYYDSLNSKNIILLLGTSKDTDGDSFLSSFDRNTLYIYDVSLKQTDSLDVGNGTSLYYEVLGISGKINVKVGLDKNNDGYYDSEYEPSIVKIHSLQSKKTEMLINSNLQNKIQDMIEGKKVKF